MSRGPGKIEHAIEAALDAEPMRSFSAAELCLHAYRGLNRIEKKHTFAVTRSMRAVVQRRHDFGILKTRACGNPLVVFTKTSLASVRDAARREKPALGINGSDFETGGPWDRAIALVAAQNDGNAEAVDRAIEMVRADFSPAYMIDFPILEALFGVGAFDRLLKKDGPP